MTLERLSDRWRESALQAPYGQRIALVGNGPLAKDFPPEQIDRHDMVIRFNACRSYGQSGSKVDVIVIANTGKSGEQFAQVLTSINEAALSNAECFWLTKCPEVIETEARRQTYPPGRWTDYSEEIIRIRCGDRPWMCFGADVYYAAQALMVRNGGGKMHEPSSGLLTLFHLRERYPGCKVTLFGFSHAGWTGHAWDAERSIVTQFSDWVQYADP